MHRTLLLLIFAGCAANAQTVKVIDKVSREPISGAVIHTADRAKHAVTNEKGLANLRAFDATDSLQISYVTYETLRATREQLERNQVAEMRTSHFSLDEIVVSANRWEEKSSENPNRIEKMSRKEISLQNAQTTADVLESGGYVFVQKSQMAGGSPALRGFATNRVLLVVDGVRMNNAIFRSGNLQNVISLDVNALESTEVLFGPGAVMYGSDAIGGVMDFHTLRPQFADSGAGTLIKSQVMGRTSSANNERTGHFDFNAGFRRISLLTSITYAVYDDLRAGSKGNSYFLRPFFVQQFGGRDSTMRNQDATLQVGSAFSQTNLMQKIAFRIKPSTEIDYAFHYSVSSDAPRYDRLYLDADNNGNLDFGEWYYGPQKWTMHRAGFKNASDKIALYSQLKITAAMQEFQESRHDRRFRSKLLRSQFEKVKALSLNVDLDKEIGSRTELFYGGELVTNTVQSRAHRTNTDTKAQTIINSRYPDNSTWRTAGIYINLKHSITPKVILNAGLRYSRYRIEASFDTLLFPFPVARTQNVNGSMNGSLGAVIIPTRTTRLYATISSGFRAPNIDDMGKVFDSQPGTVIVPNPALGPEYAWNAETGMVKILAGKIRLDIAGYFTLLTNALARRDFTFNDSDSIMYEGVLSRVMANQNVNRAYVYGFQAGFELDLWRGWRLEGKLSYQEGFEQNEDSQAYYPKTHVPPMFGRTDLRYSRKKLMVDLYTVYQQSMPYDRLSLTDRADNTPFARDASGKPFVPGWMTVNARIFYYPTANFEISGGIENITDRLYRPFSSGISAPGRNFVLCLRIKV